MGQKDTDLQTSVIYEILKVRNISVDVIELYQKNSRVSDYLLDGKYILRVSKSIPDEQMKQDRVKSVSFVPQIHSSGSFSASGEKFFYLMTDYVQGDDLWSVIQQLTDEQKRNIGRETAQFLNDLHSITGTSYDIGHYIATIPNCKDTWKDGHLKYAGFLRNCLSEINICQETKCAVSKAFDYINTNIDSLEYQTGAKLLHNDFHPKNIIVHEGRLSGIIDWECSQFGEADFELVHLFHWCIYPSVSDNDLHLFLQSIVEDLSLSKIPNIEKRLTIYQLEHELNQLIWNGRKQEDERLQRINGWLNGQISALLKEWQMG